jgi:ubiquinone/menaquinone biosynthesis C-methylase UbiE
MTQTSQQQGAGVTGPALAETRGSVDLVSFDNGGVSIAGWVASPDGTPIDELQVLWSGEPLGDAHVDLRLPSPDVSAVYPLLRDGDRCRYLVRAAAPSRRTDVLLSLRPKAGGRSARRLYKFIEPTLPEPPREHIEAIGGEFTMVALEMLDYFVELADLKPHHRVLDVGCGVGRIAYALAYYLDERGSFDGFDVMRQLVDWANANLASRRPNFRFRHVDIYNGLYNPGGTLKADTFAFPYPDASFDLITVTSVFTHIQSRELRHYLDEIGRVLAPGGRVASTAFVINDESAALIREGKSTQPINIAYQGGFIATRRAPEAAVGYADADLRQWLAESGLTMRAMYPGSWCGRPAGLSYQDLLVLERSSGPRPARASGSFLQRLTRRRR